MKKRFIAGVVLASLALWSVPVAFASLLQPASSVEQKPVEPSSSMHDHDCCPGVHSRLALPAAVIPYPAEVPCEQHPCCAKQAPQSQPALPAASTRVRPGSEGVPVVISEQHRDGRTRAAIEATCDNPFQLYSVRSTVLRI
jgi:hypothetical protein